MMVEVREWYCDEAQGSCREQKYCVPLSGVLITQMYAYGINPSS